MSRSQSQTWNCRQERRRSGVMNSPELKELLVQWYDLRAPRGVVFNSKGSLHHCTSFLHVIPTLLWAVGTAQGIKNNSVFSPQFTIKWLTSTSFVPLHDPRRAKPAAILYGKEIKRCVFVPTVLLFFVVVHIFAPAYQIILIKALIH